MPAGIFDTDPELTPEQRARAHAVQARRRQLNGEMAGLAAAVRRGAKELGVSPEAAAAVQPILDQAADDIAEELHKLRNKVTP